MNKRAGISITTTMFFVVLVMLFGMVIFLKVMHTTRNTLSAAQIQYTQDTLKSEITSLSGERTASKNEIIPVASKINAVCFVGENAPSYCNDIPKTEEFYSYEQQICGRIKTMKGEIDDNVYIFPQNQHFSIKGVNVQNIMCFPVLDSKLYLKVSIQNGKTTVTSYNPEENIEKNENPFIEPRRIHQQCNNNSDCYSNICYNHECVECTSDENCSVGQECSDGECVDITCGDLQVGYSTCKNTTAVETCNATSAHEAELIIQNCAENSVCSQGECTDNPTPDKECEEKDDKLIIFFDDGTSTEINKDDPTSCSLLNDTWIGELKCDDGELNKSKCKTDNKTIPLRNDERAVITIKEESENTKLTIEYNDGEKKEYTYSETYLGLRDMLHSHHRFYCPNGPGLYYLKIKFCNHCWGHFHYKTIKSIKIMPTGAECEPCINSSPLYACGYKGINEANKVEKRYCPGEEECYKVSLSACSNAGSSCQSYKTNGGNLIIELLEPTLIALPANFYNQISKYCCGESSGNNDIIEIPSGQNWIANGNSYHKINFKIKQAGYKPYKIRVESETVNGWYEHTLGDSRSHCYQNGNCYYRVIDNHLVAGRTVRVTITVKKGSDTATAQARVTVESADGGGENSHHCGEDEVWNATSGHCEPKGDGGPDLH